MALSAFALRTLVCPVPAARWLGDADEPALRALLQSCYGDTYAIRSLYQEGYARELWRSGQLLSLGEFDEHGQLRGHTGILFKDHAPAADFVESGLSFAHPGRRALDASGYAAVWRWLLRQLAEHGVSFLLQQTSTLHALAQRYAQQHLRARPTGLILHYSRGERPRHLTTSAEEMHALVMATVLRPLPQQELWLPPGAAGELVAQAALALALPRTIHRVPSAPAAASAFTLETLEHSRDLGLRRRRLIRTGSAAPPGIAPPALMDTARVDLIHVPATAADVTAGAAALRAAGYRPVALRPRAKQPDELVYQHLPESAAATRAAVSSMRLYGELAPRLLSHFCPPEESDEEG